MSDLMPPGSRGGWESVSASAWYRYDPGPSRKLAGWALALTFVPLFVNWFVSIGLAVLALVRIHDRKAGGPVMAWIALVLSCVFLLATSVGLVIDVANDPPKEQAAHPSSIGDVSVLDLKVGDCLTKEPTVALQATVPVGPCSDSHRAEVFAVFDLRVDASASQRQIDRLAEGGCIKRFDAFVGTSFDQSELDVLYLKPVAGRLDVDRGVACIVEDRSGPITGSLKNSRR